MIGLNFPRKCTCLNDAMRLQRLLLLPAQEMELILKGKVNRFTCLLSALPGTVLNHSDMRHPGYGTAFLRILSQRKITIISGGCCVSGMAQSAQHHLEALPAGWFYNGTQFVSFDGEKQDIHPSLEDFIINHIKEVNKGIEKYNADIENAANSFTDLFEK